MRQYAYPVGDQRCATVSAALRKLYLEPLEGVRVNFDLRNTRWFDAAKAGFDPKTYDGTIPPPIGWSAHWVGSFRDPGKDDLFDPKPTGVVVLMAPVDIDAKLAADKTLTEAEKTLLASAVPVEPVPAPIDLEVIR